MFKTFARGKSLKLSILMSQSLHFRFCTCEVKSNILTCVSYRQKSEKYCRAAWRFLTIQQYFFNDDSGSRMFIGFTGYLLNVRHPVWHLTMAIQNSARAQAPLVVWDSLQPYGPQPARLLCPWDSAFRIVVKSKEGRPFGFTLQLTSPLCSHVSLTK